MGQPTKKDRINLVVERELYDVLKRLGNLQQRSMASIVVELLEAAAPALTELRDTLERAAELSDEGKAAVLQYAQSAAPAVDALADDAERQWDMLKDVVAGASDRSRKFP